MNTLHKQIILYINRLKKKNHMIIAEKTLIKFNIHSPFLKMLPLKLGVKGNFHDLIKSL